MFDPFLKRDDVRGRSPRGERGLKFNKRLAKGILVGRSPRGERGLKFQRGTEDHLVEQSLPARGAWIEIPAGTTARPGWPTSLPARGAWIEIWQRHSWGSG